MALAPGRRWLAAAVTLAVAALIRPTLGRDGLVSCNGHAPGVMTGRASPVTRWRVRVIGQQSDGAACVR